jgi:tRNA-binding protein
MSELKKAVAKESSFDLLEIRLGHILEAELEPSAPKPAYRLKIDFGKFGIKTSVGRFTTTPADQLIGKQVLGVLNFEPRQVGNVISEVLTLGVQVPKADSGEAMIVSPVSEAKIGGKLF